MDAQMIALVIAGTGALGVVVWVLAKLGKTLIKIAEALAAAALVIFAVWLVIKAALWALRQVVTHWRTSLAVVALAAWWHWWGWASLTLTTGVVAGVLTGWRLADLASFDAWAGRHLRAWWLRWTVYAPKLPQWLHACGLSIKPDAMPVVVAVNPLGRSIRRSRRQEQARLPQVLGVRSGASWDEVRIRLVPGQKPEDFDTDSGLVFTTRKGTPIEPRNVNRTFDALIARAKVTESAFMIFTTHAPRSSFAQGVDLQTIRDLLGHSSIGVTSAICVDVLREVQRDAVDRLRHLFEPDDETDT